MSFLMVDRVPGVTGADSINLPDVTVVFRSGDRPVVKRKPQHYRPARTTDGITYPVHYSRESTPAREAWIDGMIERKLAQQARIMARTA